MALPKVDKIWMDGALVDWDAAQVHVLTHALHYGSGVFEGIRCYETADGPAVFRLTEHMERFERSAKMLFMDLGYSVEEMVEAVKSTIRVEQAARVLHPPAGVPRLRRHGARSDPRPRERLHRRAGPGRPTWARTRCKEGVDIGVSSWRQRGSTRCRPRSRRPATTSTPRSRASRRTSTATTRPFSSTKQGKVCEGTGENLFIVRDGVISTPPVSDGILEGITRDSIMVHRRGPRLPGGRGIARAHRPLHVRRDVHDRHGRRGRARALGRPPRDRPCGTRHARAAAERSSASCAARSPSTRSGSSGCSADRT